MGSVTSKDSSSSMVGSSSSSGARRWRSRVFGASCFSMKSTLRDDNDDDGENGSSKGCITCMTENDERIQKQDSSTSQIESGASSSIGRSRSRFGFIPDRIGFKLSRTVSLGSSRDHSMGEINSSDVNIHNEIEENAESDNAIVDSIARNDETRHYNRRLGYQEPLEGSVRFSRTLSVGRLRDRVIRRTLSSQRAYSSAALVEDRPGRNDNVQVSERRAIGGRSMVPTSLSNEVWPEYARNHPHHIYSRYDRENGANNYDSLEHRSAFLERRRRIRSQVRALQRLGSRFENLSNLSGHERSCILSGQHRTGRCTCRASNRVANPNDDTGTRASISRIVMLAEALFEVLDEIHQQSVALTSRPSFSSIGSVPAPKEVVECMPMKVYRKPQKHQNEESAQCYICLVEYEDGDFMRILPCNHEFHQTCIDKWLKEIHRVCPLCRGDVCRPDALGTGKVS